MVAIHMETAVIYKNQIIHRFTLLDQSTSLSIQSTVQSNHNLLDELLWCIIPQIVIIEEVVETSGSPPKHLMEKFVL